VVIKKTFKFFFVFVFCFSLSSLSGELGPIESLRFRTSMKQSSTLANSICNTWKIDT
jgi:hypothetical protein